VATRQCPRDASLTDVALLPELVEKLRGRGVGSGRTHEDAVHVIGSFVDRGRDTREPGHNRCRLRVEFPQHRR